MDKRSVSIPTGFVRDPFYEERSLFSREEHDSFEEAIAEYPFYYDMIAVSTEGEFLEPWKDPKTYVPVFFNNWKNGREELAQLFRNRKRTETLKPMVRYLSFFIDAVFWMNGSPVTDLSELEETLATFRFAPVNVQERLLFIMEQPNHYHAFIQLTQLYEELEKQFHTSLLKKHK